MPTTLKGAPIDQRTPLLALPLPHIENWQEDDVKRLRAALGALDGLVADRATQAQVVAAVASLVGSSPAALDTLQELGAALGNDPHFATSILNALAGKASTGDAAALQSSVAALQAAIAAVTFASLQGKPNSLSGYGIGDGVYSSFITQPAGMRIRDASSSGFFRATLPEDFPRSFCDRFGSFVQNRQDGRAAIEYVEPSGRSWITAYGNTSGWSPWTQAQMAVGHQNASGPLQTGMRYSVICNSNNHVATLPDDAGVGDFFDLDSGWRSWAGNLTIKRAAAIDTINGYTDDVIVMKNVVKLRATLVWVEFPSGKRIWTIC